MSIIMKMRPELNIDFNELKASKSKLISIIAENNIQELDGIVSIIDAIQDHAADNLGVDSEIVYDLH